MIEKEPDEAMLEVLRDTAHLTELAKMRAAAEHWIDVAEDRKKEITALRAECERLRAALADVRGEE